MAINRIKTGGITDGTIQSGDIAPGTVANDRLANTSITINGTAVALGGSVTAGTDWQAVTVADGSTTLTAEAGKGYFLDTNTGVIEVFLPTSPSRGDTILVADYAGTFATNNVIINTGTNNLDSTTTRQYKLTTNDTVAEFVYVDSAKGWITRILQAAGTTPSGVFTNGLYDTDAEYISATGGTVTTSGDYKVHSFTGDGCFVVSAVGNPVGSNKVSYLVVAGGGGSGANAGGGGGAGGFREGKCTSDPYTDSPLDAGAGLPVSVTTYPVTVGAGGAGSTNVNCKGPSGSNSIFSTITSAGGGGGGSGSNHPGNPGGSGGGGRANQGGTGGTGNTPPVSPSQGNNGGNTAPSPTPAPYLGGGGGGATAAGATGNPGNGAGGAGATTSISGSPTAYAGGGGGASNGPASQPGGPGGVGGGGTANTPGSGGDGTAGTANTGGGGGGNGASYSPNVGLAGGKGIVIIRYKFQN
tara:strand:- start:106 stop:1515 length:1410 start_codon:yes stop_codon:yes gene_type:complete